MSIPSPDGAIIASTNQNIAISAKTRLPYSGSAFGAGQNGEAARRGVVGIHVPQVGLAHLISQGQNLLFRIHTEPDEPNLAVFEVKLMYNGDFCFTALHFHGFECSGFPTNDGILAGFGKYEISEPSTTIDVISVNVSGGKVGEMDQFGRKRFLGFESIVLVGGGNGFFNLVGVEFP